MKKGLWMLGLAAAAMTSCTQSEVLEVAENRAIGFEAFVNKNTRAISDITNDNFSTFYVFGDYDGGNSVAYSNTKVNGGTVDGSSVWTPVNLAYWQTGKTYTFGAYSDGGNSLSDVEFSNGALTISKYTVSDKDLVASVVTGVSAPNAGTDKNVPLTFKHLLSKIKFTFKTSAVPEAYIMKVSDMSVSNAIKEEASVTIGTSDITTEWTGTADDTYEVEDLADYAVTGGSASTEEYYIIPQSNQSLEVTFTVTLKDEKTGAEISNGSFTANLATTNNKWEAGYAYNYTATIEPDKINDQLKPIKFTVTSVEGWNDYTDEEVTPSNK